ncbi:MAG: carbohydrate binding domain-containing protein [Bacteroidia bacterium]|nr:carbohydrate binding domain-containing protein [Bacteroidia bacterium]
MKKLKTISRKTNWIVLLAGITLLSSCALQMSESVNDPAIGLNGGFETVEDNLPVNWLVNTPKTCGSGSFEIVADTSDKKEGHQSLCFKVQQCSDKGGRYSPGIAQEIPVKTGEDYLISFWIKNSETNFKIDMSAVSAHQRSDGPKLTAVDSLNVWRWYSYHYQIPASMNRLRLEVSVLKSGTFWIDAIKVEKL